MKKTAGALLGILMVLAVTANPTKAEVVILQQSYTQYAAQAVVFSQAFKKTDGAATYQMSKITLNPITNYFFTGNGAQIQIKIYNTVSQSNLRPNFSAGTLGESTVSVYPGSYYYGEYSFSFPSPVNLQKNIWYAFVVTNLSASDSITLNNDGEWMSFKNGYSGTGGDSSVSALFLCYDRTLTTCNDPANLFESPNGRNTSFTMYGPDPVPPPPPAAPLSLRLPFKDGESWQVTRGYNTEPTHTNSDSYALDFAQSGCVTWGKPIIAIAPGKVEIQPYDSNGYGNHILINHGNGFKSRYAHLNLISVKDGQFVFQGEEVGIVGNTGDATGTACDKHPGTHVHLAYYKNGNAELPEPMSEYTNFTAFSWYPSNNKPPVAIYHLDDNCSAKDGSSNGNCGYYLLNGPVLKSGIDCAVSNCLSFNGTSDYIDVPDNPSISITGVNLSITGWMKTSASGNQWIASKWNGNASNDSYGLYLSNGKSRFAVSGNGINSGVVESTLSVNDGTRHHVVATYDGTTLKVYIDGILDSTATYVLSSIFDSNLPLRIGAKNDSIATEFFNGMLDEVVIYDRTLTPDEVNNIYQASKP